MTYINRASLPFYPEWYWWPDSIPHRRIILIYFLVLFAGIVLIPLKISLAPEFKPNTAKVGSIFFLNLLILPWHERPIMTKGSWLWGWVTGGQSSMNFIAFTESSSSSQSILNAKKREKNFCVWWSYTKRNCFKKAFREANLLVKLEMWCGEWNIETGGYISLSFVLFFFFQFPKKVPGVCSLSNPWEPSFNLIHWALC